MCEGFLSIVSIVSTPTEGKPMTDMTCSQQARAAAIVAAAAFCAPCEASTPADVLRIAEEFACYIATGANSYGERP